MGGQRLRDFFSPSGGENVDVVFIQRYMHLAPLSLEERALITTQTGYLGSALEAVRPEDMVAVLSGCNCPAILRPYGDNLHCVVGECYV